MFVLPREGESFSSSFVTLPLGAAIQRLPADWHLGFHLQAELVDLGQYVGLSSDKSVDRKFATAFFFGGTAGPLVGTSKASLLLGVQGGYAPALTWTGTGTPPAATGQMIPGSTSGGAWRLGFVVGTYVPFFDFD